MTTHAPLPDSAPHSPGHTEPPQWQGRLLPRPTEEVQDQGLAFDLGTLLRQRHPPVDPDRAPVRTPRLGRRRLLGLIGAGGAAASLAACAPTALGTTAATSPELIEIPDETAGPYPADGSGGPNALTDSGIVRSDIRASTSPGTATADGVPMTLELTVLDLAAGGTPYVGAAVYIWHCDRSGDYSLYAAGLESENYLRGVQIADQAGLVRFTSIFPACYSGRWPHIHLEVYPDQAAITDHTQAIATSQVALPTSACDAVYATPGYASSPAELSRVSLDSDMVFGDDGGAHQLGTTTGDVDQGFTVALTVPIDTRTTPVPASGGGPGGSPSGPRDR